MVTQAEREWAREESRRMAQMDHDSAMYEAREEGRRQGEKIGVIQLCEQLLNRPRTPAEQLTALSIEQLTRLADDLQKQVQNQP